MKTSIHLVLALCVIKAAALAQESTTAIDNAQVKVLQVFVQPHVKTRPHDHKVNRVMVYLQPGRQQFDFADGKSSTLEWRAGEAKWSPAAGMHVAEITTNDPVAIVEIEVKNAGNPGKLAGGALDPVKVDHKHYAVEFENDQVRVLRVRIGPHESTPIHTHVLNRVITYITDQDFSVTSQDGKTEHVQHKAGDVSWGGPATHKEENLSEQPFEVVVVELKD